MKKLIQISLIILFSLTIQWSYANTMNDVKPSIEINSVESENAKSKIRSEHLILRLNEIKLMDKSHLNRLEKKSLRKEVNTINKELVKTNGGIYLSVGAVLLVILLLIILL